MSKYCHHCGNPLPEDSLFCNHCGERVGSSSLSSSSSHGDEWERSDSERERELKRSRASRDYRNEHEEEPNTSDGGGSAARNTIIAIIVLAALALWVVNKCFFSGSNRERSSITDVTNTTNEASNDIFYSALKDNNLTGDGASVAYAIRVPAEGNSGENIYGITFKNETQAQKAFYKIYHLVPKGDKWEITLLKTQNFDGRSLNFDASELDAEGGIVPQTPTIDGKKQFFYAYLSTPSLSGSQGQVELCLFDPDGGSITKATYSGAFTSIDGKQRIPCDPYPGSGSKIQWLNEQARNFKILSLKSQLELDDEKKKSEEEKKKAEEEKKKQEEEKKKDEAAKPNDEVKSDQAEAKPKEQDKDKPLFSKDQIADRKSAGSFTVFLLKDGRVVRYNNSTGSNAVIFSGKALKIGFEDTAKGILNIRTGSGVIQYNLNTGQQSRKAEAPQKETPKEPQKQEKKQN